MIAFRNSASALNAFVPETLPRFCENMDKQINRRPALLFQSCGLEMQYPCGVVRIELLKKRAGLGLATSPKCCTESPRRPSTLTDNAIIPRRNECR